MISRGRENARREGDCKTLLLNGASVAQHQVVRSYFRVQGQQWNTTIICIEEVGMFCRQDAAYEGGKF